MHERPVKKQQEIELDIAGYAFGGNGIGKMETPHGPFALFVQNTLPGQRVKALVQKVGKRHAECRLLKVLNPSPDEVPLPYQPVPGAPYATLPVELQAKYKTQSTIELFKRIGKVANAAELLDEYIESPSVWHYRNKMEYSFSQIRYDFGLERDVDEFALGFKHRGTWWIVENLERESGLFDSAFETILVQIGRWCRLSGLDAWHPPRKVGFYRHLVVRKSFAHDQLLINLVTSDQGLEQFKKGEFIQLLQTLLGQRLAGVLHTINNDVGDRIQPLKGYTQLIHGRETIAEQVCGMEFEISMGSFFQTNPQCAEKLYYKVAEYVKKFCNTSFGSSLLDLYCGTGTITLLLARLTGLHTIGVDVVPEAIDDARRGAEQNRIGNAEFHAMDADVFIKDYLTKSIKPSGIVLDPPRAGIAPKALQRIMDLASPLIIYVSCNPATLARDMLSLHERGYQLQCYSLVDQFPHTAHIECIAVFTLT